MFFTKKCVCVFLEKNGRGEVSILGPLGYEPNALPLRHPAFIRNKKKKSECVFTKQTVSVFLEKNGRGEVSILGPLGYEPNALPLRYPANDE